MLLFSLEIGALPQSPIKKLFGKSFLIIFKNFFKKYIAQSLLWVRRQAPPSLHTFS